MMTDTVQSSAGICRLVTADTSVQGIQGLDYPVGTSAEQVGATGLPMQIVTIPPGARAKAVVGAGDFFYIPTSVSRLPYNPSETEPFVAVITRTDPNEQESLVLRPDLEAVHPKAALDITEAPFGCVGQPLLFHRRTLSGGLRCSPLPVGWDSGTPIPSATAVLEVPAHVIENQALRVTAAGVPFSEVVDIYADAALDFVPGSERNEAA